MRDRNYSLAKATNIIEHVKLLRKVVTFTSHAQNWFCNATMITSLVRLESPPLLVQVIVIFCKDDSHLVKMFRALRLIDN